MRNRPARPRCSGTLMAMPAYLFLAGAAMVWGLVRLYQLVQGNDTSATMLCLAGFIHSRTG